MQRPALQFKVTLKRVHPVVWRRIIVPWHYTFFDFHCAIQNAMGWTDSHLHEFVVPGVSDERTTLAFPFRDEDIRFDLDESKEPLAKWFPQRTHCCGYTYDLGDGWEHEIDFEKAIDAAVHVPACVQGANACPPEDCAGPTGFQGLKRDIRRDTRRGRELRTWMGIAEDAVYDPTRFNVADVTFEDPKARLTEYLLEE